MYSMRCHLQFQLIFSFLLSHLTNPKINIFFFCHFEHLLNKTNKSISVKHFSSFSHIIFFVVLPFCFFSSFFALEIKKEKKTQRKCLSVYSSRKIIINLLFVTEMSEWKIWIWIIEVNKMSFEAECLEMNGKSS